MTYLEFFKMKDTPFRLTPDVDYFFPSENHCAALETLEYSIKSGEAFAQITGQPGVGKTILVRHLLNQLEGEVRTALILHPRLDGEDLLKVILEDLGAPAAVIQGKTKEGLLRLFREDLLAAAQGGRTTVVIIDEAQEIPNGTLEELRLLSNLETEKRKLLSIILVGQPELEEKLNNAALRQLHQRITIRYGIQPFSLRETMAYITHRLSIAGAAGSVHFSDGVLRAIHRQSAGIPRKINVICERALMAACVDGVKTIKKSHLKRAVASYLGTSPGLSRRRVGLGLAGAVVLLLALGGGWWASSSTSLLGLNAFGRINAFLSQELSKEKLAEDEAATVEKPGGTDASVASVSLGNANVLETVGQERVASAPVDPVAEIRRYLVVNRLRNEGKVWQGEGESLKQAGSFELQGEAPDDGVYVLGNDPGNRPFIFSPHHLKAWQRHQDLAQRLWEQFGGGTAFPAIPLVVWSRNEEDRQDSFLKDSDKVRTVVRDWAAAWRSLDVDTYIRYYSPIHFNYPTIRSEPTMIPRDHYYNQVRRIFQRSSAIALEISDPVCVIDPSDPKTAVAIFSQRYASARHVDEGIKVLYLKQWPENESGKFTWRIEGRCWIPAAMESKGKT